MSETHKTALQYPSFPEALAFWFRLGLVSFGGPAGQIAMMHTFLVEQKRWISPAKFLHALNYCMLLPGPEAQQMATYAGWLLHGRRGGLAAGLLFILPSAVLLWILSVVYVQFGQVPVIQSVLDFLKPAVVAIVAGAIVKIGKKSLHTPLHYGVAIIAFVVLYFLKMPYLVIILGAILVGIAHFYCTRRAIIQQMQKKETQSAEERGYVINQYSDTGDHRFSGSKFAALIGTGLLIWALPLVILAVFSGQFDFWQQLIFFFTKAALVTFGGAYAVLPYVAQVSVEKYGWLTQLQMIDGLALGETTPGPLIMVLAFVGFMAGFTVSGGSVLTATLGLLATVFYTFLPSFLFIFAGAPLIERTQTNPGAKAVLQFVSAAVTGVILSLCIQLGRAVLVAPDGIIQWWALLWMSITFAVLQFSKISLIGWIGISIAVGCLKFFLF